MLGEIFLDAAGACSLAETTRSYDFETFHGCLLVDKTRLTNSFGSFFHSGGPLPEDSRKGTNGPGFGHSQFLTQSTNSQ